MNKIIIPSLILLTLLVSGCSQQFVTDGNEKTVFGEITLKEALEIAQSSVCVEEGALTGQTIYNENTKTWWIDLHPNEEKPGCNPACVVSEATKTAEINWRCTGLITE